MGTIYYTDGRVEEREIINFLELREIVEGYVQVLGLPNGEKMIMNEEGRLQKLPVNQRATDYLQAQYTQKTVDIFGNVIILDKNNDPKIFNKV